MSERNEYEIRHFDTPVLGFWTDVDEYGSPEVGIVEPLQSGALLPLGLEPTDGGLWKWLSTRALPFNRLYADHLCLMMGIRPGDVQHILSVSFGLSLNDCYWVVPQGFEGMFADYNLFSNPFSEVLSAVAYTGHLDLGSSPLGGLTPELTTGGTLRKAWRIIEGQRLLYKGSTPGWEPGEWLSECLASQVATHLGLDAVAYAPDIWENVPCSVCKCFCTQEVSYTPLAVAAADNRFAGALSYAESLGPQSFEAFADMWVFDALICNTDRHLTNVGVLLDARTNQPLKLAPVFDSGRSLFPNVATGQLADAPMLAQLQRPAVGGNSFEQAASRVMGDRQLQWLAHMEEFEFDTQGLGEKFSARLHALEAFLRERAHELGCIEPVNRDEIHAACASYRERSNLAEHAASPERIHRS